MQSDYNKMQNEDQETRNNQDRYKIMHKEKQNDYKDK